MLPSSVTETIKYTILVDSSQAVEQAKLAAAAVRDIGPTTQQAGQQSREGFVVMGEKMKETSREAQKLEVTLKRTFKGAGTEKDKFKGNLGKLGQVAKYVFGTILGITAISIFRDLIRWFKEATTSGYELAKSFFNLSIGVRAMQRSGIDITIRDVTENIQRLRKEFGIFTTKEMVDGTATLLNLTRTFGFTKEQIFELQDAIVKLAVVNGRAMDEVQRVVALAVSSGYTEGLQRLGVSINKVTIAQKAAELGWKDGYNSLTEYQRAVATLILVEERTAAYQDDLAEYQKTAPGRIDAMTASWNEFKNMVGNQTIPVLGELAGLITQLIDNVTVISKAFFMLSNRGIAAVTAAFATLSVAAAAAWNAMRGQGFGITVEELGQTFKALYEGIAAARDELWQADFGLGDEAVRNLVPEDIDLTDFFQDAFEQLLDLQDDYTGKLKDAEEKFHEDMNKISRDYLRENAEIWQKYYEKLADIQEKVDQQVEDADRQLQRQIEDLNRDTQEKLADANKKYREKELKAQQDFQEKLRRLQEEFLFDLEDALRKRDAAQILRLIRRYNLDRAQLEREKNQEKDDRAQQYADEIADIQDQRAKKLAELRIEHQRRLEDIQIQAQREREAARQALEQQKEDAMQAFLRERAERIARYEEDLEALKQWLADRTLEIFNGLVDQYKITGDQVGLIVDVFKNAFGPGGSVETQYDYFVGMIGNSVRLAQMYYAQLSQMASQAASLAQQLNPAYSTLTPEGAPTPGTPIGGGIPGYASGGTLVATRPTLAMFGEVPEVVHFTPLNQMASKAGMAGRASILIQTSPDLVARIVDNTMGQMADIQLEEMRR